MGVNPKIMGKFPNHPFVHRVFHEIYTIHFGGKHPYFWKHPKMMFVVFNKDSDGFVGVVIHHLLSPSELRKETLQRNIVSLGCSSDTC